MAVVIGELLHILNSEDRQNKMTKEEGEFFVNWRSKTINSSFVVASAASSLVYIATRKLSKFNRFSLAGGAGLVTGYWRIKESFNTCVGHILDLDGTRMQHELKKIVLQRYGDDPRRMQPFSKHFYCEEVYSDSNPLHPRLIYRQRSAFIDDPEVAHEIKYGSSDANVKQQNYRQRNDPNSLKPKGPRINPGISMYGYGDPLDVIFGYASAEEVVQEPDASGDEAKVQGRNQKRSRRRQRMRHRHRESLSLNEAPALRG